MTQECLQNKAVGVSIDRMQQLFGWQRRLRECVNWESPEQDEDAAIECLLKEVGQILKVDRCFLAKLENSEPLPIRHEYLRAESISSFLGGLPPWGQCPVLCATVNKQFSYIQDSLHDVRIQSNPALAAFFKAQNIRAGIGCPVIYNDQLMSVLAIHQSTQRIWSTEEFSLVMVAADQIALVAIIAAQRRAEADKQLIQAALLESEKKFSAIFSQAAVGIAVVDMNQKFVKMNQKYCDIVGYTDKELYELAYHEISHPDDLEECGIWVSKLFEGEIDSFSMEKRFIKKDGEPVWVSLSCSCIKDKDGKAKYGIGVAQDITARKQAEEALLNYQKRLEQSNKDLEQFATVASHDLQAPLRKVLLFSTALVSNLRGTLSPENQNYMDRLQNATSKMQALITDLLALSQVHRRGQIFKTISLTTIVREAINALEYDLFDTKGKVEIGEMVSLEADPHQILQLMQNLIENALKFHQEGIPPVVSINSKLIDNDWCEIQVSDQGIGFDEKYRDRIFRIFERLHGQEHYSGTGIGLAICQKIVERHHGKIEVKSAPNEGATFIVQLPVHQIKKDH